MPERQHDRDRRDDRMRGHQPDPARREAALGSLPRGGCGGRSGGSLSGRAGGGIRFAGVSPSIPALAHARLPPRAADDAPLDEAEHRGRQRESHEHRDRDGDRGRDAHRGQERDAGERQSDQGDEHRHAGEDHGRSGGSGRSGGGLLGIHTGAHLILMSGDDEQRIVDADGEAEHESQEGSGRGDAREGGGQEDQRDRQADADDRGEQRKPGDHERAERHDQHEQRDDEADALGEGDPRHGEGEQIAAQFHLRSGGQLVAQLRGDILQSRLRSGRHVGRLAVELHADDRGIAAVGDLPVHDLAERVGHGQDAVEVFELGDRVGDLIGVRRFVDLSAVGGHDDHLRARAAGLRERAVQLLDARLRLRAGDREGVVGALPEGDSADAGDAEQQQPGDEHAPRVAVRPATERVQKSGHSASAGVIRSAGFRTNGYSAVSDT